MSDVQAHHKVSAFLLIQPSTMKTCLLLLLIFIQTTGFAHTYYVSPSGNDNNNGLTIASAFLSLQHASDIVQAGDTVQVLAGTYVGFYHTTSGTSTNPIVFTAQPNVLINQPNATTDDGINLEGSSYVIVEGFNVYGVPRAGIRSVINDHVIIRNNTCDSCYSWEYLRVSVKIFLSKIICAAVRLMNTEFILATARTILLFETT